jgi:murein DD-endopeptidase MepM/ murein hydrolase activator NlpD
MTRKRLYTFIVATHADSRVLRFSIPYPILIAVAFFAFIGLGAAGMGSYHYVRMLLKVTDYDHRLVENNNFRHENHSYRIQTAQLGERIDLLETMYQRVARMAGFNDEARVGGVGGLSKESLLSRPITAAAGETEAIVAYSKRAQQLEERYRTLDEKFNEQLLVQASRPIAAPVVGYITGLMGRREDPFNPAIRDNHVGVDISAPHGKQVVASADGIVIYAGAREGYGNIVVIDHKFGWSTRYGHLSRTNVQVGQRVSRNDVVGFVGMTGRTTGPHLHYEIWLNSRPVNPMRFLAANRRG